MARVFVSSTYVDLKECRQRVRDALRRMGHEDVAMEYFVAEDRRPVDKCLEDVRASDVYVGIFASRYGSIPKGHDSSITELEYREAVRAGKECLILLLREDANWPVSAIDSPRDRIDALRAELQEEHTVGWFSDEHDLEARLTAAIVEWGRKRGGGVDGSDVDASVGPVALHQLPPPPGDFTGREAELDELQREMERGGVTLSGIQGMGGVGKTVLALKLAAQLAGRYPDAQIFLELKGASEETALTASEAMAHVVRSFHPTAQAPESESALRGMYMSVLHGKRALLLMDNALDRDQVAPLIPPEGSALLVTSRQHFTLPGLFAKDLDTMTPEDAGDLLLTIAPRIGDEAAEIARLCGYLPLALRYVASAVAERPDLSPSSYVERLAGVEDRLTLVEESLALSYDLLSPEIQVLWRAMATFPDTFDFAAAAAVWAMEPDAARDNLSGLRAYSLVEWSEATDRYGLHDLARVFAASRLGEAEGEAAWRRHAEHYAGVLALANDLYLKGGDDVVRGLALFDLERANIEAGQAWAAANAERDNEAARLCSAYPRAGTYVLDVRLHRREWIAWLEEAVSAARRLKERSVEGGHLGNLGLAYAALGETRRAIEYHAEALAISRKIGDRRGEGQDLGNLGNAFADLGETRRAIELYWQRIAIAREFGDRRDESIALGSLGNAFANLGETRRASEYYEQSLAISREIGDRRGEGNALGSLGIAYSTLGETRRAIEYHEQALVISREIGDRRGEGGALGNLGIAYAALGETRRAIELCEQQFIIVRETGDRRGEGAALGGLGNAYAALGETRRAQEFYEQQLRIVREIGDRRGEGAALGNLGIAYSRLGETRRAIELYEQRITIAREIGDRQGEGNALFNMALALDMLGEREKAIASAKAALEIYEQIEDPNADMVRDKLAGWREEG